MTASSHDCSRRVARRFRPRQHVRSFTQRRPKFPRTRSTTNPATEATGATTPPRPAAPRASARTPPRARRGGGRWPLPTPRAARRCGPQFWGRSTSTSTRVALNFVDAEQLAPPPSPARRSGPPIRARRPCSPAPCDSARSPTTGSRASSTSCAARRAASWSPSGCRGARSRRSRGRSRRRSARRGPRVRWPAAEIAYRSGGALSIDHPDRIRISHDGNAVLAFPGNLPATTRPPMSADSEPSSTRRR